MTFTSTPLEIDLTTNVMLSYSSGFTIILETPVPTEQFTVFATSIKEVWSTVMTECELYFECLSKIIQHNHYS